MIKYDFNREWTYYKEGSDSKKKVNLPHDAMIYERRNRENPSEEPVHTLTVENISTRNNFIWKRNGEIKS